MCNIENKATKYIQWCVSNQVFIYMMYSQYQDGLVLTKKCDDLSVICAMRWNINREQINYSNECKVTNQHVTHL